MTPLSESERATQNRVARLFCDELGYRPLGNWQVRRGLLRTSGLNRFSIQG